MKTSLLKTGLLWTVLGPLAASAQVTTKPDGVFRSLWGAAASVSGGTTQATTLTLTAEAVQQTDRSKWNLMGRGFYARGEQGTTAASLALGTQFDRDLINQAWFTVGKLDAFRDRPSNIDARVAAYGGLGRHLIRDDPDTWDVFSGLGYAEDHYVNPADVAGTLRTRYGRTEWLLSQSSTHKLTPNTSLRQKLEYYANLRTRGEYRAVFDTGLTVAISARLQLTTGLLLRYNSDPGLGLSRNDSLFLTGVSLRFD